MRNGEVVRPLYAALGLTALLVMLGRPCSAENNSNYIFNGTTTNIGGTFIVGNTGTNNSLQILNGGAVTNTDGYLGYLGGGDFNTGLVTDPGSIWYNSGSLWVGYNFARTNTLTIANQGRLVSNGSGIGAGNDGNGVIVTGNGSVWTNTGVLYVGYFTPRNYLTVTSTGKVVSTSGVLYVGYNHNSNQLTVSNGGQLDSSQSYVGFVGSYNQALVTGTGSVWNSSSFIQVGATFGANRIIVSDGGHVNSGAGYIGAGSGSDTGIVTGAGSIWTNSGDFYVGYFTPNDRLVITDGGRFVNAGNMRVGYNNGNNLFLITNGGKATTALTYIGDSGNNNQAIVTGTNSSWTLSSTLVVGQAGNSNQVSVRDGAQLSSAASTLVGTSNSVLITGSGSSWTNAGDLNIGQNGVINQVTYTDGARGYAGGTLYAGRNGFNDGTVFSNKLTVSNGAQLGGVGSYVGFGSDRNSALVTDSGSSWNLSGAIIVGQSGHSNLLTVSNGGAINALALSLGGGGIGNRALITGSGSSVTVSGDVGAGNFGSSNVVLVTDGGTLEATGLRTGINAGTGNAISNIGGVFQFPTSTPTIAPSPAGSIAVSNGTISFRAITNAPTTGLGNLSYTGNNSFRLNNASNAFVSSYTFDSTGNPTNYQRLVLQNNARWRSTQLTVGPSGSIKGGTGDVVEIRGNFTIQRSSNPAGEFDLASSTVVFGGGVGHTNAVTGRDLGNNGLIGYPDGFTAANFSFGKLSLGSSADQIYFASGDGAMSNALYVLNLDLLGSTNFVANLHSPTNINIYYGISSLAPANAYLNDQVYTLNGGGLLMPAVPEPSTIALLLTASLGMVRWRRRSSV